MCHVVVSFLVQLLPAVVMNHHRRFLDYFLLVIAYILHVMHIHVMHLHVIESELLKEVA